MHCVMVVARVYIGRCNIQETSSLQTRKDTEADPNERQELHPRRKEKRVVYEIPCKECHLSYIGETKRTLRARIGEHKQAVKRGDPRNGIAVHVHQSQRAIDWDGAKVKRGVSEYWKRRSTEAIHIRLSGGTMNLDNYY